QQGYSCVAAGYRRPETEHLAAIRQEIYYNCARRYEIVNEPELSINCRLVMRDTMKRAPVGFSDDNPYIDWLKLKSFTAIESFTDSELERADAVERVLDAYRRMHGFKLFLHEALGHE